MPVASGGGQRNLARRAMSRVRVRKNRRGSRR